MEPDPTATYASANWIRAPIQLEPFHQLGGMLPAKRQNTEFLDESNTWLITTNVDYRAPELQRHSAYSTNVRPSYLRQPGYLPADCPLGNQARIRDIIENQAQAASGLPAAGAPPSELVAVTAGVPAEMHKLDADAKAKLERLRAGLDNSLLPEQGSNLPLIVGLVGLAALIVLMLTVAKR